MSAIEKQNEIIAELGQWGSADDVYYESGYYDAGGRFTSTGTKFRGDDLKARFVFSVIEACMFLPPEYHAEIYRAAADTPIARYRRSGIHIRKTGTQNIFHELANAVEKEIVSSAAMVKDSKLEPLAAIVKDNKLSTAGGLGFKYLLGRVNGNDGRIRNLISTLVSDSKSSRYTSEYPSYLGMDQFKVYEGSPMASFIGLTNREKYQFIKAYCNKLDSTYNDELDSRYGDALRKEIIKEDLTGPSDSQLNEINKADIADFINKFESFSKEFMRLYGVEDAEITTPSQNLIAHLEKAVEALKMNPTTETLYKFFYSLTSPIETILENLNTPKDGFYNKLDKVETSQIYLDLRAAHIHLFDTIRKVFKMQVDRSEMDRDRISIGKLPFGLEVVSPAAGAGVSASGEQPFAYAEEPTTPHLPQDTQVLPAAPAAGAGTDASGEQPFAYSEEPTAPPASVADVATDLMFAPYGQALPTATAAGASNENFFDHASSVAPPPASATPAAPVLTVEASAPPAPSSLAVAPYPGYQKQTAPLVGYGDESPISTSANSTEQTVQELEARFAGLEAPTSTPFAVAPAAPAAPAADRVLTLA